MSGPRSESRESVTNNLVADPEVDLFAGMKKKKKKQVQLDVEEPAPSAESSAPAEAEPAASTSTPAPEEKVESQAAPADEPPADDGGDLFADLKKKKKKKKELPADLVSWVLPWKREQARVHAGNSNCGMNNR